MTVEQFTAGVSFVTLLISFATFVVVVIRWDKGIVHAMEVKNNDARAVLRETQANISTPTKTLVFSPSDKKSVKNFMDGFEDARHFE